IAAHEGVVHRFGSPRYVSRDGIIQSSNGREVRGYYIFNVTFS
ncbi:unnamed protein product, partial [Rotaria sp. Silwood1]